MAERGSPLNRSRKDNFLSEIKKNKKGMPNIEFNTNLKAKIPVKLNTQIRSEMGIDYPDIWEERVLLRT